MKYHQGIGYKRATLYMIVITVILCAVYYIIIKLCRLIWEKWLKDLFTFRKKSYNP